MAKNEAIGLSRYFSSRDLMPAVLCSCIVLTRRINSNTHCKVFYRTENNTESAQSNIPMGESGS